MPEEPKIPDEWSDVERWAWDEIRAGHIVDFHERCGKLDPKIEDSWDDEKGTRLLSSSFLATIFTDESFRCVIPIKGVRINGALFKDDIDLQHVRLEHQLWLNICRFQGSLDLMDLEVKGWLSFWRSWFVGSINLNSASIDSFVCLKEVGMLSNVDLTNAKIGGQLDIAGSIFEDKLNMNGTEVTQSLHMSDGATFKGEVDLTNAKIGGQLYMEGSTFDGKLNMNGTKITQNLFMRYRATFKKEVELIVAKIGGQLSMTGGIFEDKLNMNGTEITQHLFMGPGSTFSDVDLSNTKIGGQLDMGGSTFDGKLNMGGIEVTQHLFMRYGATFKKEVELIVAKIDGQLSLTGGIFKDKLNMNGTEVTQHLFMGPESTFSDVDLTNAKIGGQLDMGGSTFDGKLDMGGIDIGQVLYMRNSKYPEYEEIALYFARIDSNLDMSGATVGAINLTGTTITGELHLGSAIGNEATKWVGLSRMLLRNTSVGAIQDTADSWPKQLELEGFEYKCLGGFGAQDTADILSRPKEWFIKWLEKDKTFTPEPYEKLANVLRKCGYTSKANAVLYAGRERLRDEAFHPPKEKPNDAGWLIWIFLWWIPHNAGWLGLTTLKWTIGYGLGIKYFRVLWWVATLTLIGFLVLLASVDEPGDQIFIMVSASFDQVLPVITLDESHKAFISDNCNNWAIGYFYAQEVIGYVLAGFLVAGLAGLTQNSRN